MPTYFIQSIAKIGQIKIGYSNNPKSRLKRLESLTGKKLVILGITDVKEHAVHYKFRETRVNGEWFEPTSELFEYINNPYPLPDPPGEPMRIIRSPESYKLKMLSDIMQSLNDEGQDEILKFAQRVYDEALSIEEIKL